MKKIQFLENDYKCPASDSDLRAAKRHLKYMGIPVDQIENMVIHYQFRLLKKDEIYKIIFDSENIIATYSVYTSGSDSDFVYFMGSAGRNGIKNMIYLDSSGQLIEFLNRKLREDFEGFRDLACGINTNRIITMDFEDGTSPKKIRIEFKGSYDDCVVLEDFDINEICK
jgi:hypothetical protein